MEDFNDDFLYDDEPEGYSLKFTEKDFIDLARRYIKDSFINDGESLTTEFILHNGKKYSKARYFLYFKNNYTLIDKSKISVEDTCFEDYIFKQALNKVQGLKYDMDKMFDIYDAMIEFVEYGDNNEN